ncbi:hypothetical protein [Halococcus sp. AFM35]|uniref:hypothetical protein n=1 Tax=Halococcus sp. AFM35 TaxID=3421653 RepID=UPI003EBF8E3C
MMPSDSHPPDSGAPRKAVLYCPTCGHDSPVDGDWRVARDGDDPNRVDYRCPVCDSAIANRPRKLVRP